VSRSKTRADFWNGMPDISVCLKGFANQTLIEHFLADESSDQWDKTPGDKTGYLAAANGIDLYTYYRPIANLPAPTVLTRRLLILASNGLPLAMRYVHPGNQRPDPLPFSGILSSQMFDLNPDGSGSGGFSLDDLDVARNMQNLIHARMVVSGIRSWFSDDRLPPIRGHLTNDFYHPHLFLDVRVADMMEAATRIVKQNPKGYQYEVSAPYDGAPEGLQSRLSGVRSLYSAWHTHNPNTKPLWSKMKGYTSVGLLYPEYGFLHQDSMPDEGYKVEEVEAPKRHIVYKGEVLEC